MKYISVILICFLTCCSPNDYFESHLVLVGKQDLKDGSTIKVFFIGGGATAPDVAWVRKIKNTDSSFVGKIKDAQQEDSVDIAQLNDTIIKIRFTNTGHFKGMFREYRINLNNRIEPNDGSPYADRIDP